MNSMTGYGKGVAESAGRKVGVEIKSVNHRFLDMNIKPLADRVVVKLVEAEAYIISFAFQNLVDGFLIIVFPVELQQTASGDEIEARLRNLKADIVVVAPVHVMSVE